MSSIPQEFSMISGVIPANALLTRVKLKLAIVGGPKKGKSWLAATGPKPILVYDFDDRAESLRNKDGVFIKTLIDKSQTMPTAMKEVENDLAMFKSYKLSNKPIPATFVFDSVTYMKKAMENECMNQESSIRREVRLSPSKSLRIPKGWDAVNTVRGYLDYIVAEFSQLGHVIFVFHERDEKDVDKSTTEKTAYTGRFTVDPQYLATVLSTFNEVWRIDIDPVGNYVVQIKADNMFGASTTLEIDKATKPDINFILDEHAKKVANSK